MYSRDSWRRATARAASLGALCTAILIAACADDPPPTAPAVDPTAAAPNADVVSTGGPQIDGGTYSACGVRTDSRVVCWGDNRALQTVVPSNLGPVTQVSAGAFHACGLKPGGTVVCWGADPVAPEDAYMNRGQAIVPFTLSGVTQVVAGSFHTCALTGGGTVRCWGQGTTSTVPIPPAGLSGVEQISAGSSHTCALRSDGTVTCWGVNNDGESTVPGGLIGVTQVSAGGLHSCALRGTGTVVCWGRNDDGEATPPSGLSNVSQITTGGLHSCAVKADGTVVCWGNNEWGQTTLPSGLSGVIQVSAAGYSTCALKVDYSTTCWGTSAFGVTTPRSIVNRPPTVAFNATVLWWEGSPANVPATVNDPDGDPLTYRWTVHSEVVPQATPGPTLQYTFPDEGQYTVGLTVSDAQFSVTDQHLVRMQNAPPRLGAITAPSAPVAAGVNITIAAPFTDPGRLDTHQAGVRWGAGALLTPAAVTESNGNGSFAATRNDLPPGVYPLSIRVSDNDGGVADTALTDFLVVYDPSAGYVTGKGAIRSPLGACRITCYGLDGRATFGFTSRYENGAARPTGATQFEFRAGNLNFASTSYEWLVVAGARAQYKGEGTINGGGTYGFLLTAVDGDIAGGGGTDRFRIKIWDKGTGLLVYDNQLDAPDGADPTTELASGSIIIRK